MWRGHNRTKTVNTIAAFSGSPRGPARWAKMVNLCGVMNTDTDIHYREGCGRAYDLKEEPMSLSRCHSRALHPIEEVLGGGLHAIAFEILGTFGTPSKIISIIFGLG